MKSNLNSSRGILAAIVVLASVVSSQCSQSTPTSPAAVAAGAGSTSAVGDPSSEAPTLTEIRVCRSAASNVGGTVGLTPITSSGTYTVLTPLSLAPGECKTAAIDTADVANLGTTVTVTDQAPDPVPNSATLLRNDAGTVSGPNPFNGSSLFLNSFHGFTITFTNQVVVITGNEGCTPGYWKQSQHFDNWVGYSTGDDFDTTFGVDFFSPDRTLLQAVWLGSGGYKALARHAVAALLNTSNSGVDYPYTTAQVLDIVQGDGAYLGLTVEQRKDLLAAANELGCPLN